MLGGAGRIVLVLGQNNLGAGRGQNNLGARASGAGQHNLFFIMLMANEK